MTGDQHYQQAERLLAKAEGLFQHENATDDRLPSLERRAQAHATMALAAATEKATVLARDIDAVGYGR